MYNNIVEDMKPDEWIKTSAEKQKRYRIMYLHTFISPLPQHCPECQAELTSSPDEDETLCPVCGLITSMSIDYVAGQKIDLPYGRH